MKKKIAILAVAAVSIAAVAGVAIASKQSGTGEHTQTNSQMNAQTNEQGNTEENNEQNATVASDWLIPKITIDGVEYTFPMEAQELVKNGWVMDDNFPVPARPGANALIMFEKDGMELFTNVSSTTGKEQPIEEGEVCSLVYGNENSNKTIPMAFPGGITLGMSKADVEKILPEEYKYDEKYHCFKYAKDTEQGKLDIQIQMTEDDSEVKEIHYTCWTK